VAAGRSLLESLAGLIERTYAFRAGLGDLGRFIVGDAGYRRLAATREVRRVVERTGAGARLLVRPEGEGWAATIYYPDSLISCLERHDPRRSLGEANLDAFAVFTEELDHLLTLADRARPGRPPLTLLEMEWHAEVTKYLTCAHFLARIRRRSRLGPAERQWLRYRLFESAEFVEPDPEVNRRYRESRKLAVRMLERLRPLPPAERLRRLRRFHRDSHHQKLRRMVTWPDSP
jgi:hypothetical protein